MWCVFDVYMCKSRYVANFLIRPFIDYWDMFNMTRSRYVSVQKLAPFMPKIMAHAHYEVNEYTTCYKAVLSAQIMT